MGWELGIPDLGGSAYTNMANNVSGQISKAAEGISGKIKQNAATNDMLKFFAQTGQMGKEDYAAIDSKSMGAKQQFLGLQMASQFQKMQAANELQAQQNMLGYFQGNRNALDTKRMLSFTPGQMPPMGIPQGQAEPTGQPSPAPSPQPQQTANAMPPGWQHGFRKDNTGKMTQGFQGPNGQWVPISQ